MTYGFCLNVVQFFIAFIWPILKSVFIATGEKLYNAESNENILMREL